MATLIEPQYVVAMDIGGTNIRTALISTQGQIVDREQRHTIPERGLNKVLADVIEMLRNMVNRGKDYKIVGIGIGAPGPLDPKEGVIIQTHNLGWKNVALRSIVRQELQLPTYLDNDCNMAALGERWLGVGRGVDDFVCLTLGTGVGGAIFLNGRVYHGAGGTAGHIGHFVIDPNGPKCGCGGRGHLEAYASSVAIVRRTVEAIRSGHKSMLSSLAGGDLSLLTSRAVFDAAEAGDELAMSIFKETGAYIGLVLVSLMNILDPKLVVIGGQVAQAGPILFDSIRRKVEEFSLIGRRAEIVPAILGNDAGILGAAAMVLQGEGILRLD